MSDPGYGSYIANAAEAERNRRSQGQQLLKKLDMQKYGIDTSASNQIYGIDTNKKVADDNLAWQNKKFDEQTRQYNQEYGMRKTLFDQQQADYTGVQNTIQTTLENKAREAQYAQDDEEYNRMMYGSYDTIGDVFRGEASFMDMLRSQTQQRLMPSLAGRIEYEDVAGPVEYKKLLPKDLKGVGSVQALEDISKVSQGDPGQAGGWNFLNWFR